MALSLLLFAEDSDFARGKDPDDAGGLCRCVGEVGAVGEAAVDTLAEERRDVSVGNPFFLLATDKHGTSFRTSRAGLVMVCGEGN